MYGNNIHAKAGWIILKAKRSIRFFEVSSVIGPPAMLAADKRVRKIISGITSGKPKTAMRVALFPARDAMALMVVKRKE
jgi:hypothetical protein